MKKNAVLMFLSLITVIAIILAGCAQPETSAPTAPSVTPAPAAPSATSAPAAPSATPAPAAPSATPAPAAPSTTPAIEPTAEVLEFRMSSHMLPDQTEDWVNRVDEATGGRVKITVYASSSLISLKDTVTGLKAGTADIALVTCETFPEAYPLNNVLILPFLPLGNKEVEYQVWHALQDEFPELTSEWDGFQVLYDDVATGNVLHMVEFAATTPKDMDGMRMFATATIADIMEDQGATPLYLDVPDWFTSLDRGLLDGMWLPWEAVYKLKIYPLLPYHTTFPSAPGMLMKNALMRKDAWNTIPPDLQKAILDLAPGELERRWADVDRTHNEAREAIGSTEGTIVDLTPEEVDKWYQVAKPYHDTYLDEVDAMGLPATEVYNEAIRLAAEYTK